MVRRTYNAHSDTYKENIILTKILWFLSFTKHLKVSRYIITVTYVPRLSSEESQDPYPQAMSGRGINKKDSVFPNTTRSLLYHKNISFQKEGGFRWVSVGVGGWRWVALGGDGLRWVAVGCGAVNIKPYSLS